MQSRNRLHSRPWTVNLSLATAFIIGCLMLGSALGFSGCGGPHRQPEPDPDPEPADCKKPGQACGGAPAPSPTAPTKGLDQPGPATDKPTSYPPVASEALVPLDDPPVVAPENATR